MNTLKQCKALYLAIACVWFTSACTVQPTRFYHGTIPAAFAPTTGEAAYGKQIFTSLSEDYPIDTGSAHHTQLISVFNHLAETATADPGDWQVYLFDAPEIADIRAVQGNYIFVWSGIFDVTQSEDELAGLLACEMAHELANHTDPVEFNLASELLFGFTDIATSVGLMVLTQGAVSFSGPGMTRWAYVEATDMDPVDRVYSAGQIEDMAAIALLILDGSSYSPEALLQFWKRAESDTLFQEKVNRLSRKLSPLERVTILEGVIPQLPARHDPDEASEEINKQTVHSGEKDSI
ncbi:MAG: M48 family metalloprotease [Gammaproteobacteria bacterium]|jgi:predicted Zn-dependent protease